MKQPVILIAEDEPIVGFDLCNTVAEAGYTVEGPHRDVSSAMLAFQKHRPDAAILDVKLDDGTVFPLAEKLMEENVPIIFHSGQMTEGEMAARFPTMQALAKPCPPARVIESVQEALATTETA